MRHVATHGHNRYFGCEREGCPNLPAVHGTHTRCRCEGWQTQNNGKCTACDGYDFADWEWELLAGSNSGGFVETEFPIKVIAYRGETEITVTGVREDSISSKLERNGNVTLSFETYANKDRITYIPCVDWYATECE